MHKNCFRVALCSVALLSVAVYSLQGGTVFPEESGFAPTSSQPLIIYYSLTGTTRTIAEELAQGLSAETEEIISLKNRHLWGVLTCVNDQLLDRDDVIAPLKQDISGHDRLILASPVWIHRISSPMRTFIKYSGLKGKEVVLILTNQGNYSEDDEKKILESVESIGITVKRCYSICTKGKSKDELQQHARSLLNELAFSITR